MTSDVGSIISDMASGNMRGAAGPLKAARKESVIEALEKKRRESIQGPKLKGKVTLTLMILNLDLKLHCIF